MSAPEGIPVQLVDLSLVEWRAKRLSSKARAGGENMARVSIKIPVTVEGQSIRYDPIFTVEIVQDGMKAARVVVAYTATFEAAVTEPLDLDGPSIESFGRELVIPFLIPYVRELVSSSTSRLGLRMVTLDLTPAAIPRASAVAAD